MIDSHCHPQLKEYDNDREEVIKRALDGDVQMVCVGVELETSKKAIELAKKNEGLWATVGLHPNDYLNEQLNIEDYYKLASPPVSGKKVVAIGEIGLDYYRTTDKEKQDLQKKRFVQLAQVAADLNLPIVVHSRDAQNDLLDLLKKINYKPESGAGVIHSFTGSSDEAKEFIDLNYYVGLNGIITYSKDYEEMVKNVPLDRILIETDAPFLAPPPFRGKRNEPLYVKYVAEKIAEIKNISVEEVENVTTENTKKLFKI
jgi:TatD DNase family protein